MMNKQELINKLEELITGSTNEYDCGHDYGIRRAIVFAKKLDDPERPPEPEKPVVPQYVADFYESIRDDFEDKVYGLCAQFYEEESELSDGLYWWFKHDDNKPIETFVKMKLYGYDVEKEKLYTVEIPNPNGGEYSRTYLGKYASGKVGLYNWTGFTHIAYADDWKKEEKSQLTEAEIKKDFAWAWKFAEEVEEC